MQITFPVRFGDRAAKVATILAMIFWVFSRSMAATGVDVKIRIGNNSDVDTLWVGALASFDFYFENDLPLTGMTVYFRVYSEDGADWTWEQGVYRIDSPADTVWRYATVEEDARMYPPDDIWDYYGLALGELDFDGLSPDTFFVAGASRYDPIMAAGPIEHDITVRFRASGPSDDQVMVLCIDTTRGG